MGRQRTDHRLYEARRRKELAALEAALCDDRAPRFTVGQVSELLDMRPWFLRRLDALGVVTPTRSDGDQRRYSRVDVERLVHARALMRDGVSAAGVRRVFELEDRVAELEAALCDVRSSGRDKRSGSGAAETPAVQENRSRM